METASSTDTPTNDRNTDVENIAIANAPKKQTNGTANGTFSGYFLSHKYSVHDSRSGNAATSVLKVNMDWVAGGLNLYKMKNPMHIKDMGTSMILVTASPYRTDIKVRRDRKI